MMPNRLDGPDDRRKPRTLTVTEPTKDCPECGGYLQFRGATDAHSVKRCVDCGVWVKHERLRKERWAESDPRKGRPL